MWNKIDKPNKLELLDHVINGKTSIEIADHYFVSEKTVNRWCKSYDIKRKRGAKKKI